MICMYVCECVRLYVCMYIRTCVYLLLSAFLICFWQYLLHKLLFTFFLMAPAIATRLVLSGVSGSIFCINNHASIAIMYIVYVHQINKNYYSDYIIYLLPASSALSLEEQRLLQSLERLNQRLEGMINNLI